MKELVIAGNDNADWIKFTSKELPKTETTKAAKSPQALARSLVKARLDEAKRLAETVIKPSKEEGNK